MQTPTTLRRFSPNAIMFALVITLVIAFVLVFAVQFFTRPATSVPATNTAAQDLQMVMQELERERLDQLSASSYIEQLRARNIAAQDKQMVMQELEREQYPQSYANSFDAASIPCHTPRPSCDR
jgi:hypothetical protein